MPSIAAAAIGAAGAIGGSLIQSNAAKQASSQQVGAENNAIAAQKGFFSTADDALSPYYKGAQGSEGTLSALLNPGTSASTLSTLPGFQFQSQWGTKSAQNALAAEGLGGSTGPLASAISQYNQGVAGTYFTNETGALQNQVNSGVAAGGALASNATATGQGIANTTQAAGNAAAAGTLGSANALAGGLTSAGSAGSNALLLSALLGNSGGGGLYSGGGGQSGLNSLFSTQPGQGFGSFASA